MLAILLTTILASPTRLVIFQTDEHHSKFIQLDSDGKSKTLTEFDEGEASVRNWLKLVLSPDRKKIAWARLLYGAKPDDYLLKTFAMPIEKGPPQTKIFPYGEPVIASFGFDAKNQISVAEMDGTGIWHMVGSNKTTKLGWELPEDLVVGPHWNPEAWVRMGESEYTEVDEKKLGVKIEWRKAGGYYVRWSDGKEKRLLSPAGWFYSVAPSTYPYVYVAVESRKYIGHGLDKPYIYQFDVRDGSSIRLVEGASVLVITPGTPFPRTKQLVNKSVSPVVGATLLSHISYPDHSAYG